MRWMRPWPWVLASLGSFLVVSYGFCYAGFHCDFLHGEREEAKEPPPDARPEMLGEEENILSLARDRRYPEALGRAEELLEREELNERERGALRVIRGRLLVSMGRPDESVFREVIESRCSGDHLAMAYQELAMIRWRAGDYPGAIRVFQELIASRVDDADRVGPTIMDGAANYRHYAAMSISRCFQEMGDGKEAHRWALRAKYDWPYRTCCGTGASGAHEAIEDRLEETARLAGVSYRRETYEASLRWKQGPPAWEIGVAVGLGSLLVAAGGWALRRRRVRFESAGDRLRSAALVTAVSLLPLLTLFFPRAFGPLWKEGCLWGGLLGMPIALCCWYRWGRVLWWRWRVREA